MTRPAALDPRPGMELWAGVECSVVRIGDEYHDQLVLGGHANRPEDLDRIAGLGIRTLRQPILWERTAPDGLDRADWTWADERLGRLRVSGIRPIVGLVHHGGGPRETSLVEPSFADGLAAFAGKVAGRYPWVDAYTPVNEPLTTARFSGLYGHWYPHGRDARTFALALLNQCRAVVLAMRAVRDVNPKARLVQTDDMGRAYGTPSLAYQVDFENERRWLAFDLLCGRVDRGHPLWDDLIDAGLTSRDLGWFCDNPCPPDVVGLNHYLTSDRFLDRRLRRYPPDRRGGNAFHRYADVEAVRVYSGRIAGPGELLREAWGRYGLPVAITETHLDGTREEQLRWLLETWTEAKAARAAGADVRAVTAWALFGLQDWDSLMARIEGHYEPGAFDIRSPEPRPTALATALRTLASGREPDHPVLDAPGWWHRPERLIFPRSRRAVASNSKRRATASGQDDRPRQVAIFGASGTIGQVVSRLCALRGLPHRAFIRVELDIADEASVVRALDGMRSWAVIDAAVPVRVDGDGREPAECPRANVENTAILASACASRGLPLLTFSSDLVFDGSRDVPYVEGDAVNPLSVQGRNLVEMETRVLKALPSVLIARSGPIFGPWNELGFVSSAPRSPPTGGPFAAEDDVVISPTYVTDLIHAALDLLIDGERGVWHLANPGAITRAGLARRAAELAGLDPSGVAVRPATASRVLGIERGHFLPPLDDAMRRYRLETEASWTMATQSGHLGTDLLASSTTPR